MIFSSLRDLWRKARTQTPAISTERQAKNVATLRGLAASEEWQLYLTSLDDTVRFLADELLRPAAPSETIHFLRGKIAGLRQAGTLVDEILAHARAADAAKRNLAAVRSDPAALTFASPFFRAEKPL